MQQITVIEPTKSLFRFNWRELWEFRSLIWLFAKRDLLIVYKQTILGPLWFVIQPVLMSFVFATVFGRLMKNVSTDGLPHIIFFLSGFVLWNYFKAVTENTALSLGANSHIFSKVWFPRLVLPVATVITNFTHFLFGLLVFFLFYFAKLYEGHAMAPTIWLAALPLLMLYVSLLGLGVGMWFAAAAVKYRDLGLALPIVMQMWMFASPVIYTLSGVVDPVFRALLLCNPMAPAIEMFRLALTGAGIFKADVVISGSLITLFLFITGLAAFNRAQRNFVDVV